MKKQYLCLMLFFLTLTLFYKTLYIPGYPFEKLYFQPEFFTDQVREMSFPYIEMEDRERSVSVLVPLSLYYVRHLQNAFFGSDLEPVRGLNLLVHAFNVLLLFLFTLKLFEKNKKSLEPSDFMAASSVAFLFCVNPVVLDAMPFVNATNTLLSFLFGFTALNLLLRSKKDKLLSLNFLLILFFLLLAGFCDHKLWMFPFTCSLILYFFNFQNREAVLKFISVTLLGLYLFFENLLNRPLETSTMLNDPEKYFFRYNFGFFSVHEMFAEFIEFFNLFHFPQVYSRSNNNVGYILGSFLVIYLLIVLSLLIFFFLRNRKRFLLLFCFLTGFFFLFGNKIFLTSLINRPNYNYVDMAFITIFVVVLCILIFEKIKPIKNSNLIFAFLLGLSFVSGIATFKNILLLNNPEHYYKRLLGSQSDNLASRKVMVQFYLENGQFREAATQLEFMRHFFSDSFEYQDSLARFYEKNDELKKSVAHYENALRLRPDMACLRYKLGELSLRLNKQELAGNYFYETLKRDPGFSFRPVVQLLDLMVQKKVKDREVLNFLRKELQTFQNYPVKSKLNQIFLERDGTDAGFTDILKTEELDNYDLYKNKELFFKEF